MVEQRYQAVLAVISDGLSITQVASKVGVSRQTLHAWLVRYEAEGSDYDETLFTRRRLASTTTNDLIDGADRNQTLHKYGNRQHTTSTAITKTRPRVGPNCQLRHAFYTENRSGGDCLQRSKSLDHCTIEAHASD
ncbi:transposase [Mycobacteroides abscessus subsp. massiliense]|nr:transposase [Mycobacteroides abscessus subsp. massiliense]SKG29052.1 transposase [Mycobacteroides abscessus subsp. massiliense]SKH68844.1 transposase [Mycobacteroides abscessus subsp. massiliense]SKI50782.1 transposase [Mycobacteroides abscessus subsp. massiliense]